MAYRRDSGSRPTHYIALTAPGRGKGNYIKGPFIGMWEGDGGRGPLFRGSVKGKYLDEVFDFIKNEGEESVSFALFESRGDGRNSRNKKEDDEDAAPRGRSGRGRSSRDKDEDEDEDKGRGHGRKGKKEEEDDDEDEKKSSRSSERGSKRGGKKDDWWD